MLLNSSLKLDSVADRNAHSTTDTDTHHLDDIGDT